MRRQPAMLLGAPEPVADARAETAGTPGALLGRRARDALGQQRVGARSEVVARDACQSAVDDGGHALDGQAGLGDVGRQDHLAPTCRGRLQRQVLLAAVEFAVERANVDVAAQAGFERALAMADFAPAGQKGQHVALGLAQRLLHAGGDAHLDGLARLRRPIAHLHRKQPPAGLDHRRLVEQRRDALGLERGRHHQQAQLRPQALARFPAQREREVGVEAALVELVEDDQPDARQLRIGLQPAREQAFGDDFDARIRPDAALEAHLITHGFADFFAEQARHARRRGACREPARLEDQHALAGEPGLVEQGQRQHRGLARARRGREHGQTFVGERGAQAGQRFERRQLGQRTRQLRLPGIAGSGGRSARAPQNAACAHNLR